MVSAIVQVKQIIGLEWAWVHKGNFRTERRGKRHGRVARVSIPALNQNRKSNGVGDEIDK